MNRGRELSLLPPDSGASVLEASGALSVGVRLAATSTPARFEFLDEVPKTVTDKLLRRELRGR